MEETLECDAEDRTRGRELRLRRAQAQMLTQIDQPCRLSRLAEAASCSERSLQLAFREAYGVGPVAWFRVMRLNEAHRELRDRGSSDTRIAEVAMRWGFSHLGRFSIEYRKFFGETPSQTLRYSLTCRSKAHVS